MFSENQNYEVLKLINFGLNKEYDTADRHEEDYWLKLDTIKDINIE